MRIKPYSRLITEQIKSQDARDDFIMLFNALNSFLEQFNIIFNKNIDNENLKQNIFTIITEVDTNNVPKTELILQKGNLDRVNGVIIVRADPVNPNDPFLSSAPFCHFLEFESNIKVIKLLGFPANKRYRITFLVF